MSDLTTLSGEYAENADFAKLLNAAVLALRKRHLQLPAAVAPLENNVSVALADVVRELATRLESAEGQQPSNLAIPEEVVERIRESHKAKLAWLIQDLRTTADALAREQSLTEKQLQQLEEVSEAADGAATAVFRRLWRR